MANRILIGKRGTSDHGLYVSRPTEDVTSTSAGLMFSSDEALKGFNVSARGQGILSPGASRTFSHGLGFRPFVEVTYTNAANMTGGSPTTAATFTANFCFKFIHVEINRSFKRGIISKLSCKYIIYYIILFYYIGSIGALFLVLFF